MNVTLLASETGDHIDFVRLRADRRQRLAEAMAAHQLDAVILGRPANVHYATGARQLWTAGSRPFAPACVVIGSEVHLLSVWDEGVPPEIAHDHLFGLSWDPGRLMSSLMRIPGLARLRRVGTDGLTPLFGELLGAALAPGALVDAAPALYAARVHKTLDELRCITAATAVAEAGLSAMVEALEDGRTERQLVGMLAERIGHLGVPILASEAAVHDAGDLVGLDPSVQYAGYEGGLGRTWVRGEPTTAQRHLAERGRVALTALLAQCRPGRTGADLRAAWDTSGEAPAPIPIAYGLGLGAEPPLIDANLGDSTRIEAGMVLAVQSQVTDAGVGTFFERETVAITQAGPQVLNRYGRGPAGTTAAAF